MENSYKENVSAKFANMSLVCAFLVVGIHIGAQCLPGSWSAFTLGIIGGNGLLRLAVPFFFLASGYWIANSYENGRGYRDQVVRRLVTLGVPYLAWNLIWILFTYVTSRQLPVHSFTSFYQAFGFSIFERPAMGFLWFVRFLFLLVLASPIIYWIARRKQALWYLPIVFVLSGLGFSSSVVDKKWFLLFEYGICLEGLFCFLAGMTFRLHPVKLSQRKTLDAAVLLVGMLLLIARVLCAKRGLSFVSYWCSWFGIVTLMYGIWRVMPTRKFAANLTSYAFPIYLIHPFLATLLAGLVKAAGWREVVLPSVGLYLVRWVLVIVLTIGLVAILRRCLPKTASLLFGGR